MGFFLPGGRPGSSRGAGERVLPPCLSPFPRTAGRPVPLELMDLACAPPAAAEPPVRLRSTWQGSGNVAPPPPDGPEEPQPPATPAWGLGTGGAPPACPSAGLSLPVTQPLIKPVPLSRLQAVSCPSPAPSRHRHYREPAGSGSSETSPRAQPGWSRAKVTAGGTAGRGDPATATALAPAAAPVLPEPGPAAGAARSPVPGAGVTPRAPAAAAAPGASAASLISAGSREQEARPGTG